MDNIGKKKELQETSLWTKDFIRTTLSNLFLFFSFQMLLPTLPAYTQQAGGDEFQVGLVIGIFTISALLTRPFAGKALDSISRSKVLLVGLAIFTVTIISYNIAVTVLLILTFRFIHGIGWGITTTSFGTIISDIIPANRRGEGMGYYGLSSTLGMAIAPPLGIWLMNNYGFGKLFLISTILAVITLVLSQTISYPPLPKKELTKTTTSFWDGLLEKKALFPSLLVMLFAITYGGIVSFITIFGKEAGIENVGWFFTANATMILIVRPISGKIFDKKGHKWVLLPGVIFSIIGLVSLSFANNVYLLIISAIFYGIGFGTIQPSLQAWTIDRVSPKRRGAANGTFFSAFDLGIGMGAILLGLVAKATSYAMMYRLSVLLLLVYIIIYGYFLVTQMRESNSK